MRTMLPLLLLGVSACYAPRTVGAGPDGYATPAYGVGGYDMPLQASIWYDEYNGFASFDVNRPAHVAIFAIQPGSSLRMIYPAIGYGGQQRFASGRHDVRTATSSMRFASNQSLVYGAGPTYIVLIASERAMDVAAFMATGYAPWLQHRLATMSPYHAADLLAQEIVPNPGVTDWTVAYHVVWPTNLWYSPYGMQRQYVWVNCGNGIILSVPTDAYYAGWVVCPKQDRTQPPADSTRPLPRIKDKLPKRPGVPPGWVAEGSSDDGVPARRVGGVIDRNGGRDGTEKTRPPLRGTEERTGTLGDRGSLLPGAGERVSKERPVLRGPVPKRADDGSADDAAGRRTLGDPDTPERAGPTLPDMFPSRGEKAAPSAVEAPPRVDRPSEPRAEPRAVTPRVERSKPKPQRAASPSTEPRSSPPRVERSSPPPRATPAPRPSTPKPSSKPSKPGGGGDGGGGH